MARPQFVVQHFLVCQDAPWQGAAGPRTRRTLEGVGYYQTVPADAEMPELEFWGYFRFFLTNGVTGRQRIWVEVYWLDAPEGARWLHTYVGSPVNFWAHSPVSEAAIRLDRLMIPGRGRYEFRVVCKKRTRLGVVRQVILKQDFISIG